MTMGQSWSHIPNEVYKPTDELLRKLVDIVSKGGNYLLNIGPRPDGELDSTAYQRLHDIGAWMDVHGRAIYNTRPYRVWHEGDDLRFTQSKDGKTVFVFFLKKPGTPQVSLKALEGLPAHARIRTLDSGQSVKWKKGAEGVELSLPPAFLQARHPVGVLEVGF